jgi:hypothetical protein
MHAEKHLRLFNKLTGQFTDALVHEKFESSEFCSELKEQFIHFPYYNLHHHGEKINRYTTLWAESKKIKKRVSALRVIIQYPMRFFIIYFIKLAILDGYSGFIWARMGAYYSFLKYAKLYDLNKLNS